MAGVFRTLVDGVVDGVLKEILRKTGRSTTKRTKRKTRVATSAGGMLADVVVKALAPKKQVSRRKSAASRSRQKRS